MQVVELAAVKLLSMEFALGAPAQVCGAKAIVLSYPTLWGARSTGTRIVDSLVAHRILRRQKQVQQ